MIDITDLDFDTQIEADFEKQAQRALRALSRRSQLTANASLADIADEAHRLKAKASRTAEHIDSVMYAAENVAFGIVPAASATFARTFGLESLLGFISRGAPAAKSPNVENVERQRRELARKRRELARLESDVEQLKLRLSESQREIVNKSWQVDSQPAISFLKKISPDVSQDLESVARQEQAVLHRDGVEMLLLPQIAKSELLLRHFFWQFPQPILESITQSVDSDEKAARIRQYCAGDPRPSLGATCMVVSAIQRKLKQNDPLFKKWVSSKWHIQVSRHPEETWSPEAILTSRRLINFLHWMRKLRNELHHGTVRRVTAAEYSGWCDRAYGSESLESWLLAGTHPNLHRSKHIGWMSLLVAAWRGPAIPT